MTFIEEIASSTLSEKTTDNNYLLQRGSTVCCHWGWLVLYMDSSILFIREHCFLSSYFKSMTSGGYSRIVNISLARNLLIIYDFLYFEKVFKAQWWFGIIYKVFQLWWPYASPSACIVWVLFYYVPKHAHSCLGIIDSLEYAYSFCCLDLFTCCKLALTLSSKYRGYMTFKLGVFKLLLLLILLLTLRNN